MAGLTLDSGALIAAEKDDWRVWGLLRKAFQKEARVTVPAVVLAQVWRTNHPHLAQALRGCVVEPFDEHRARIVGRLLAASRTSDIVDAVVVVGAARRGDTIVTSDPDDIAHLASAAGAPLRLIRI